MFINLYTFLNIFLSFRTDTDTENGQNPLNCLHEVRGFGSENAIPRPYRGDSCQKNFCFSGFSSLCLRLWFWQKGDPEMMTPLYMTINQQITPSGIFFSLRKWFSDDRF